MLGYLKAARDEIEGVMLKCFSAFDKDGNGHIDFSELREVSKELGRELDPAELDECMKDLDINKDGHITYEEFSKWWLSGRQGLSPWMRRLLASKITALRLVDQLSAPMREVLTDATHNDLEDISTNSLTINLNKVDPSNPGLALDVKLLFLSPELSKEHVRVRALHSFPSDADFVVNLAVAIKHGAIAEVQSHFAEIKEFTQYMLPDPSLVSLVIEGNNLCIGLNLSMFLRATAVLEKHQDIIQKVQEELKVDQNVEIGLRLAASPKELLSEGAEPLISQIMKGVSLTVRINVWKKVSDVLLKIVEAGEIDSSMLPIFGGLAPLFLLRANAHLELTVDDYMMGKLQENPLVEPLMMDANTLISSISGISSDEELEQHMTSLAAPEAITHLMKVLIEHMADEVNFTVLHPQLGVQARLTGEGLALVAKTIAKFMDKKE